jgi:hypothetical protein
MDDEHPEWGNIQTSPFAVDVVDVDGWRRVFAERPGELYDEYGHRIEDPLAWLAEVQPLDDAARLRYRGWHAQDLSERRAWFAGGFYFADYEFS